MFDLYSIGEMVIDFIPGNEPGSFVRNAGGAPANVAIAAAKNGLNVGMCCSVGDDDFGRFLLKTLKENGVAVVNPELCREAITTMAFVSLSETGERSFTFARKPGADMFLSEDRVSEADILDSAIVNAGSCSLSASPEDLATEKAMRLAHEAGKLVSFDINYRDVMWNGDKNKCAEKIREVFPYVDILKISEEEKDLLCTEGTVFEQMKRYGIRVVIETLGAAGVRSYFEGKTEEIPGRKAKVVDTTGAGDAFWGGFLSNLRMQGIVSAQEITAEKIRTAVNYGNISGWICVQSKGAIASLPTKEQIAEYL